MDKDAEARYTRWCVISAAKEQTSTGSILRRKNPALSNSTMPPAGSARKSGRMQMLTQRLLRGVRQARPGQPGGPGPTLSGKHTEAQPNLPS